MKFCLNVEELFDGMDIYEKVGAAKAAGYDYIEFWSWSDRDIDKLKAECDKHDVKITGFKGDWEWSLCDYSTSDEFVEWINKSVAAAKYLGCDSIIAHSNAIPTKNVADFNDRYSYAQQVANITATLIKCVPVLEKNNVKLYIEPLNPAGNLEGMFLTDIEQTAEIIRAVDSKNIKLLCDVFQNQRRHGDVTSHMLNNLDIMDYIHVADSPDRGEPGTGELNYEYIINTLKANGFDGIVCFELTPSLGSNEKTIAAIDALVEKVK